MNLSEKRVWLGFVFIVCLVTPGVSVFAESVDKMRDPLQHIVKIDQNKRIACVPMKTDEFEALYGQQSRKIHQSGPRKEVRFATKYADFIVTYIGFSAEAEAAFQKAVEIWAENIVSSIPIRIQADWMPLGDSTLGRAGSNFVYSLDDGFGGKAWFPDALADQLSGYDRGSGAPDILASFNSSFQDWYFGFDQNPPFEKYDFVSVVLHEITHGLGFTTTLKVEGGIGSWGMTSSGFGGGTYPKVYDQFLSDSFGTDYLIDSYPNNSAQLADLITGNDIFMYGPDSTLANRGRPVRIYAPPEYSSGASISHLDEFVFPEDDTDSLMSPFIFNGEVQHDPGPIVRAIFREMGWDTIEKLHFAQFAAGGGWTSDVVIQNISQSPMRGNIQIYTSSGTPVNPSAVFPSLPSDGSFQILQGGSLTVSSSDIASEVFGTVTVTTDQPATGVIRFTFPGTGVAGVSASPVARRTTVPVRKAGNLTSGVAIRNVQNETISVELSLINESGSQVDQIIEQIPPAAQLSKFISGSGGFFENYFTINPEDFNGSLVIRAISGQTAAVGIEFESGSKITTLPVTPILRSGF